MTGLDLISVQDSIMIHLETTFPAYKIEQDSVLDNESILKVNNRVKPYMVVRWHGLRRSTNEASVAGVRHDSYISGFDVIAVAPTPRQAREILNMVMDELTGWKVADLYPLTPNGGSDLIVVNDYNAKPHLYLAINTFVFQVDSNALHIGS
jgi:hypothetical protein